MTTLPLTYPCLQTVLEHMEPNLRIQLSLHIPSIRFAEKATPMKIDNLHLDLTMIKINNTQYKLGVIQIYNGDDKPAQVEQDNSAGGISYDLNNYGVPDYSFEDVLLPGDILIHQDREGDEQRRAAHLLYLRGALRIAMIRQRLEKSAENPPVAQAVEEDDVIEPNAAFVDSQYEFWNRMDARDCKFIESTQWTVLPHILQEDGGVYPFENYLQFTMGLEGSESFKSFERLVYTKKIPEAMKHLLNQILGNRKKNLLHIKNFKPADTGILRVPQGLKLTTQKFLVGENLAKTLHALQPVTGSTFAAIEMTGYGHTLENFQHPAIQHAGKLILTYECSGVSMLTLLQGLRNFEVFWRKGGFTLEETVDFVKHLMEGRRKIGSSFTFGISREEFVEELVEAMHQGVPGARLAALDALDGCKMFPYVISIPIDESSELNIFGEEAENKIGFNVILFNFKLQIMKIGSAKDSGYGFEEKMFCDLFSGY